MKTSLPTQDAVPNQPSRSARGKAELRALTLLAVPIIIGQVSTVGMSVVDTMMAGRLSAQDLAGVAVGSSLWASVAILMIGTLLAIPAFVSQYDGAGRTPMIRRFLWQALWATCILSVLLFFGLRSLTGVVTWVKVASDVEPLAQGYLRAVSWGAPGLGLFLLFRLTSEGLGVSRPTMYIGILGLLLNIPADYIFMYGAMGIPAMGAEGCGYATALVQWCQGLAIAAYVLTRPRYRPFGLFRGFEWVRPRRVWQLFRTGLPIGITLFAEVSLFVAAALMMGRIGTIEVAGHQVAINFASLAFMIVLGLAAAITVRVGNAVGRRDWQEARFRALVAIALTFALQLISLTVMFAGRDFIPTLYSKDLAVVELAAFLLIFCGIFQIPDGLQVAFSGVLRGYKDTLVPMLLTFVAYWGVGLPLSYYLGLRLGWEGAGVWWGLIGGLVVAAALLGWRVHARFHRHGVATPG